MRLSAVRDGREKGYVLERRGRDARDTMSGTRGGDGCDTMSGTRGRDARDTFWRGWQVGFFGSGLEYPG